MTSNLPERDELVYDPENVYHRQFLSQSLLVMLEEAGFKNEFPDREVELVYRREDKKKGFFVRVYTTISKNYNDGGYRIRAYAYDAIRVKSYDMKSKDSNGSPNIFVSQSDVYRVGTVNGIVERTLASMRDCWKKSIELKKDIEHKKVCGKCGASTFVSKKGNVVCSNICWKDRATKKQKKKYSKRRKHTVRCR